MSDNTTDWFQYFPAKMTYALESFQLYSRHKWATFSVSEEQFWQEGQTFLASFNHGHRLLGQYLYFSVISGSPHKTVKLGKNSGYTRPTLFMGGREGLGLCELENAPEMQKCPKTFFCDCSFELSFWVFFYSTSKAENNYSEYTNRICLWHQELAWEFHFCGRCSEVTKETTSFF